MNQAHLHLVFNHLPIVIPIVGMLVMLAGYILKNETVRKVALWIFVLGALTGILAGATGEGAEEAIEEMAGVSHELIHEHEEIAETFALLSHALGLLSLVTLWATWKRRPFAGLLSIVVLVFAGFVLFFGAKTGTSGGEIRHPEIREGAVVPAEGHSEGETH